MVCDVIRFLSIKLFFPSLSLGELDKNHITSQNMGYSFYHIFTTHTFFSLFFGRRGVGIKNVT
jgi:hypothetical protein